MFQIVAIETGGLFNLAVDLMQLFSENTTYVGCIPPSCSICWMHATSYDDMDHTLYLSFSVILPFLLPSFPISFPLFFLPPSLPPGHHSISSSLSHLCQFSDFSPLLDALGLFFQIRDDYANLKSEEV